MGMPKRKRRKIHYGRLAVVACVLALGVGVISYGSITLARSMFKGSQDTSTALNLGEVKNSIRDVFVQDQLEELKAGIEEQFVDHSLDPLKAQIEQYLSDNNIDPSKIAWAVQDLQTDTYIESANARDDWVAASTYKLPAMMLWSEKVADGSASLDDTFKLTSQMLELEDEENPEQPIGKKYDLDEEVPLNELLQAGAIYSDNLAGHMMFSYLGGYSEYKHLAQKYSSTPQSEAFFSDKQNVLNPHYTMDLAHYLYTTPEIFDNLKYWLSIGGGGMFLEKNVRRGYIQKLGNIDEVRNVIGYYPGEFPYSVSIYSAIDKDEGEQIIADIGDICYNFFQDLFYSGYYDTADGRDPIYTDWQITGNTPGNIFWGFNFNTENKANSKANILARFGRTNN